MGLLAGRGAVWAHMRDPLGGSVSSPRTLAGVGLGGGCLSKGRLGAAIAPSAFQNKIVDRCERLQLQSAAITRHVDQVLPAKDQAVLVSPCPVPQRGAEPAPWAPGGAAELPGSWSGCRACPLPTPRLAQVDARAHLRFLLQLPKKRTQTINFLALAYSHQTSH